MLINCNKHNYVDTFIKIREDKKSFLKDSEFVCMMLCLENNIYNILELGFLEDLENYLNTIVFEDLNNNYIVDINNIKNFTQEQNIIDIFAFFDAYAICVVLEPNRNMYLGINYEMIRKEFGSIISPDAYSCLSLYSAVQKKAIINSHSKISHDTKKFANETLISCDFQKNDIIFPYCCNVLDFLDLSVKIYK